MFNKFKGIQKEREVKENDDTVKYLVGMCEGLVEHYYRQINTKKMWSPLPKRNIYEEMYVIAKNELPIFDESHLQEFTHAKADRDLDERRSIVTGLYSGCLAQILTERNKTAGKNTRIHVNGNGKEFPYLFYFIRKFDELIVENFKGNQICAWAGSGRLLFCDKITGTDLMKNPGFETGSIDIILARHINGARLLYGARYTGRIDMILASEINSSSAFEGGEVKTSHVGLVVVNEIKGKCAFSYKNHNRYADLFIKENKRSKKRYTVAYNALEKFQKETYPGSGKESAIREKKRNRISQDYTKKAEEIIQLAGQICGKNQDEFIACAEKIHSKYTEAKKNIEAK